MEITYLRMRFFSTVKVYVVVFLIVKYILRGDSDVVTTNLEECTASYLG